MKATESTLTYAEVINLTLSNMKKRRENFHQLNWLHWSEWNYFDEYLKELQDNFLRYLMGLQGKEAWFQHLSIAACHTNL